jgi:pilus assembly protein CpaF
MADEAQEQLMKLSDRLKQGQAEAPGPPENGERSKKAVLRPPEPTERFDPLAHLKQQTQQALFARLGSRLYDSSMTERQLRDHVSQELSRIVDEDSTPLSPAERELLAAQVSEDVLGYGPIQQYLADPEVTEVMANADESIYVERQGKLFKTPSRFVSDEHLRRVIERIVADVGRRIDESSPMVDARLPDGSRVNAIIPPLAVQGPILTIRKFSQNPYQVDDLISFGTLTQEIADLLRASVDGKLNILVSGGTGTGKTTTLNVLSSFIPDGDRIVTIEDAVELQLRQDHIVQLESRPPNIEGKGEVTIRDLVRNALRMRPDRIVVGEVRGGEALDMLQAMNTGHEGSLSTIHANSPRDGLARLETMVLMAGMDLPERAIREQIASAIDIIIQIGRLRDGSRRVTHITEVTGMEGTVITLQDIFTFDYEAGMDNDGRFQGVQRPTGIRPVFANKLKNYGIVLPPDLFGAPDELIDAVEKQGRRSRS